MKKSNMNFLKLINGLDDELIEESAEYEIKKDVKHFKARPAIVAAAMIAILFTALFLSNGFFKTDIPKIPDATNIVTTNEQTTQVQNKSEETTVIAAEDETEVSETPDKEIVTPMVVNYDIRDIRDLPITAQFPVVIYNSNAYSVKGSLIQDIDNGRITRKIASQKAYTYDYNSQKTFEAEAEIYEIKGISSEFAIGIKFESDSRIYPYINDRAEIITLKTLYGYASPKENFSFGEVSFTYDSLALPIERKMAVDENYIYSYLLSGLEAENLGEISIDPIFTIPVSCDAIGMNKKTISVSRNGYLQTDIMGGRICTFYIGEENVEKFAREALETNADKLLSNSEKTNNTAGFLNASPILPKDKTDLQKG